MAEVFLGLFDRLFARNWSFLRSELSGCFYVFLLLQLMIVIVLLILPFHPSYHEWISNKRSTLKHSIFTMSCQDRLKVFFIAFQANRFTAAFTGTFLIVLANLFLPHLCEQSFLKCDEQKFGILICRFDGPDLSKYYGDFGISQKIRNSITTLLLPSLTDDVQVQLSNRSFRKMEDAFAWSKCQHADLAITGYTEISSDSLFVHMELVKPVSLGIVLSFTSDTLHVEVPGSFELRASLATVGPSTELSQFIRHVALFSLAGMSIAREDWVSTTKYVGMYKSSTDPLPATNCWVFSLMGTIALHKIGNWLSCYESAASTDSCLVLDDLPYSELRATVLNEMAGCQYHLGDNTAAITTLREACSLSEHFIVPYIGLTEIYLKEGNRDSAIYFAKRGLLIDTMNNPLNIKLSAALFLENRGIEAIPHLRAAFDADNSDKSALHLLMWAYREYGFPESCLTLVERYPLPNDSTRNFYEFSRILALVNLRRTVEATRAVDSLVDDMPCLSIGYLPCASLAMRSGDTALALSLIRRFRGYRTDSLGYCCSIIGCDTMGLRKDLLRFEELEKILQYH